MLVQLLGIIVFTYFFFHFYWKRRNLPPGPLPLPFFGNVLSLYFTDQDLQLQKWRKQFGDIQTIWLGNQPIITLHDAPTVLQTCVKDGETYAGRTHLGWDPHIRLGNNNGIVFSDGQKWRENRRFALHVLRNFGLGWNLMQERVLTEVTNLIDEIKVDIKNGKKEISIQNVIDIGVGSIINGLTFGYRYDKKREDEFHKVKKFAVFFVQEVGNPMFKMMEKDPEFYKNFPICNSYYKWFTGENEKIKDFFFALIKKHRDAIDFESDTEPNAFVEAFMRHQYKLKMEGEDLTNFNDNQLYATVLDLWVAGQETTSNTLAWLCVFLIQYPEVQEKLQKELDQVIGSDRIITLDDKMHLNYTNAVVAETQRFCNLVVFNVFHRTTKATHIHGYHVPPDTVITHQVSTIHMDERFFPEPQKFMPERFLDKNGKFFQPSELMPFGVGKRACLGEGLARLELYLFTANIANQFKLDYPTDKTDFGKKGFGATIFPLLYLCKITSRY